MGELSKKVSKLYEKFEKNRTIAKEHSDKASEYKNEIMELIEGSGRETVVFLGLEAEDMIAELKVADREVVNKKMVCDLINIKTSELRTIPDWVNFVSEGKITPEVLEKATENEERTQLQFKKYTGEEE